MSELQEENCLVLEAASEDEGKRLDIFLAEKISGWSRSRLKRLIQDGDVSINDQQTKPSYKLRAGDRIDIELNEIPAAQFKPENIPIEIIFEDEFLAVVNKPSGMVVHPGAGVMSGTLANAIAWHFNLTSKKPKSQEDLCRVGIVHRLDKETSGLLVVAKSDEIQESLSEQFRNRLVQKKYLALVHGNPENNSGKIEAPIARDRKSRIKMKVAQNGRYALSIWRMIKRYEHFSLLEVEIKTGRTHQIRVHLAYIGHPIVGDKLYNSGRDKTLRDVNLRNLISDLNRFFLHSSFLVLQHPITKQHLEFNAPLPLDLENLLSKLS